MPTRPSRYRPDITPITEIATRLTHPKRIKHPWQVFCTMKHHDVHSLWVREPKALFFSCQENFIQLTGIDRTLMLRLKSPAEKVLGNPTAGTGAAFSPAPRESTIFFRTRNTALRGTTESNAPMKLSPRNRCIAGKWPERAHARPQTCPAASTICATRSSRGWQSPRLRIQR